MKDKKPILAIIVGLFFYATFYIATSVQEKPVCENVNIETLYKIQDSAAKIKVHLYHRIDGMSCDILEIGLVKTNQQQYTTVGDSICNYADKLGFPLKSVMVIEVDTVLSKRDTLYTTKCP